MQLIHWMFIISLNHFTSFIIVGGGEPEFASNHGKTLINLYIYPAIKP